jgi:23S rRNA (guanosine2251-2'-O)-methyltransferase
MSADILVKNPHSILAALKARPDDVLSIAFPKDNSDGVWSQIEGLAARNRVRIGAGRERDARGAQSAKPAGGRESGHGATIRAKSMTSVEEMFEGVEPSTRGAWLALDCLQDPQNLGAIFRSASFFGIKGIVMTSERSAPMTATVYDISAGGVETVPYVAVANLQRAFEKAKDAGLWILGTSEHSKTTLQKVEKDRPWLIVMGNEEKGIRRLTEESCDVMCTIANRNDDEGVTSLNVALATGLLMNHLT